MSVKINAPMAVPERIKRVMGMISRAAEAGERAPTNRDIADEIGAISVSSGVNVLASLVAMGLIEIERFGSGRVITITSTGKSTKPYGGKVPHWSARGVVRKMPDPEVKRDPSPRMLDDAAIQARQVHRDPCVWCGVRGDIGCSHNVASAA